ncbi:hypothetical protein GYMLUDRAFT_33057 [Collybiopsis luxurians FD-317 M1]|nr:hypothetical protein GYMLUDRAFT_33057 [Collybiopsis luxurians FD-317 M1]
MQQFYNSYPTQPNYYNLPYDGSGPYNGYTPAYSHPQPQLTWGSTPYAQNSGLPPPMQLQSGAAPPVPNSHRSSHRRRATMPSQSSKPLRSALKQNGAQAPVPSTPAPLQRKRALSNSKRDYYNMPMPTTAADYTVGFNNNHVFQLPQDESAYMFVSFHGTDELHIENLAHKAMDEIRREIFGMWPGRLILDELVNTQWRVRFQNAPWALRDENVQWAWRMLVRLFTLFEERGFTYNTTIDVGSSSPRLQFVAAQQSLCKFFIATITNKGRTFTMVDPPIEVLRDFTVGLQSALPGHISRNDPDQLGETSLRVVELRRQHTHNGSEITINQFHCQLFRILDNMGYQLCATLPMARRGPLSTLGFGPRQELLVFKSANSEPLA